MRINLPSSAKTADMFKALPIVRHHNKWAKAIAVIIIAFSWAGTTKGQQWNPPSPALNDPIDRVGEVLIGQDVPQLDQLLLVGSKNEGTIKNIGQWQGGTFGATSNDDIWSTLGGPPSTVAALAGNYGLRMNYGKQAFNLFLNRLNSSSVIATPIIQWSDNSTEDQGSAVPLIIRRRLGPGVSATTLQIMRLNANGNVAIGTQNPDTRFEVESLNDPATSTFSPMSQYFYNRACSSGATLIGIQVGVTDNNTASPPTANTVVKGIASSASNARVNVGISGSGNGLPTSGSVLNIGVEGFADQAINASNVSFTQIAVSGTATKLGNTTTSTSVAIYGNAGSTSAFPSSPPTLNQNPRWAGFFIGDIGWTGTSYGVSDKRLKTNIKPISNTTLSQLLKIKPSVYNFNNSRESKLFGLNQEKLQAGFIAQELEEVFPDLVQEKTAPVLTGNSENPVENVTYKGVNYIGLIPYMVKATQEQQMLIEALQTKVSALEKQNSSKTIMTDGKTQLSGSLDFIGISPNPTNGLTNIKVQAKGEVNGELIMVINLNGKVMAEYLLPKGESSYTLDVTNWAAGMYIATYSANGAKPVTRTFIVQ